MKNNGRVGLDIRLWSHPGIGRYIRDLIGAMVNLKGLDYFHFLGYRKDLEIFLKTSKPKASYQEVSSRIYSLREQWEMARVAKSLPLLHVPHFNIPVARKEKLVVTVHDLIYLHDAKASKSRWGKHYVQFLFRQIEKKRALVLAVSEYTKNDLLNAFPRIPAQNVFVTHEAASELFQPIEEKETLEKIKNKHKLSKPFVLFVGSLKAHKNIPALIRAVESMRTEKKLDIDLVIVGRRDFKNKELWKTIQKCRTYVKYLGELPDEDLAAIYNLASVFVLPSFLEGFGLPVLEAMACGTPVLVSNRASLPEIAGKAGLVFDPARIDELSALLYNVLTNENLRKSMIRAGLTRAGEFSWLKTAEKTLEVYQRALE